MESFIKNKDADYYKQLGFSTKKLGQRCITHEIFDPVYKKYENAYIDLNKKIIREFERIVVEEGEKVKEVINRIEKRDLEIKTQKDDLLKSIKEESNRHFEKKHKKKKSKHEKLKDKLYDMEKDELIEYITKLLKKKSKRTLEDIAFDLEVEIELD